MLKQRLLFPQSAKSIIPRERWKSERVLINEQPPTWTRLRTVFPPQTYSPHNKQPRLRVYQPAARRLLHAVIICGRPGRHYPLDTCNNSKTRKPLCRVENEAGHRCCNGQIDELSPIKIRAGTDPARFRRDRAIGTTTCRSELLYRRNLASPIWFFGSVGLLEKKVSIFAFQRFVRRHLEIYELESASSTRMQLFLKANNFTGTS